MADYRLAPRAQRDLDEIFDFTATRWGLSQAIAYVDRIAAACADCAEAPQQAPACADIRSGYRRRSVAQHAIYFRPTDYGIAVIRILHHRRDVSRHL